MTFQQGSILRVKIICSSNDFAFVAPKLTWDTFDSQPCLCTRSCDAADLGLVQGTWQAQVLSSLSYCNWHPFSSNHELFESEIIRAWNNSFSFKRIGCCQEESQCSKSSERVQMRTHPLKIDEIAVNNVPSIQPKILSQSPCHCHEGVSDAIGINRHLCVAAKPKNTKQFSIKTIDYI